MREPRTPKEKIVKEGMEFTADFVGGFLILLVISLPMAYIAKGWSAVAGTLFVIVIIGLCLISGGSNKKKGNKYNPEIKSTKKNMIDCPYCSKKIPENAIRCRYCKRILETKYTKNTNKTNKNRKGRRKTVYELKNCPNCDAAMRKNLKKCPYCGYRF